MALKNTRVLEYDYADSIRLAGRTFSRLKSEFFTFIKRQRYLLLAVAILISPVLATAVVFPSMTVPLRIYLNLSFVLLPLALFQIPPKVYFWCLAPLSFFIPLEIVHLIQYKAASSPGAIAAVFETNWHEGKEFLLENLTFVILTLSMPAAYLALLINRSSEFSKISGKAARILVMSYLVLFSAQIAKARYSRPGLEKGGTQSQTLVLNRVMSYYPWSFFFSVSSYLIDKLRVSRLIEKRKNHSFQFEAADSGKEEVHVLIVGESSRRHNWQVYGYSRPTNPRLTQRKLTQGKNLLVFRNAVSPSTRTTTSLMRILTPATVGEPEPFYTNGSLVSVMKQAGYKTYWLSNQGKYGFIENETTVIAGDADERQFSQTAYLYTYNDNVLLRFLARVLKREEHRQYIVLHTIGSHMDYQFRYDQRSEVFSGMEPYDGRSELENAKLNQYDNSIHFTDRLVDRVIRMVEERTDVIGSVVYLSDHGENIYDDDRKLRGHGLPQPSRYEVEVPFLIWVNDEFINHRRDFWERASEAVAKPVCLDRFFESMLDFFDIQVKEADDAYSFFDENPRASRRRILTVKNELIDYVDLK